MNSRCRIRLQVTSTAPLRPTKNMDKTIRLKNVLLIFTLVRRKSHIERLRVRKTAASGERWDCNVPQAGAHCSQDGSIMVTCAQAWAHCSPDENITCAQPLCMHTEQAPLRGIYHRIQQLTTSTKTSHKA